ncbi:uncharacterized protein LOC124255007 [Haliotis rubra]|uniref:uncharacterized protein LOC124255007 n=1 Tax=Haliotis rubra TaxID=36100 RepID=UPI001EE5727F|nr:uncharacterized protein LOC124255007 [Haliotis rubra]
MSDGRSYLCYTEDVSKTNQGGMTQRKLKPKVVPAYENDDSTRCYVRLYQKYKSLCLPSKKDAFYFTPVKRPKNDSVVPGCSGHMSKAVQRTYKRSNDAKKALVSDIVAKNPRISADPQNCTTTTTTKTEKLTASESATKPTAERIQQGWMLISSVETFPLPSIFTKLRVQ